jgi:hypothetical protein
MRMQTAIDSLQSIFSKAGYEIAFEAASANATELLFINNPDGNPRWFWPTRVKSPLFLGFYSVSSLKTRIYSKVIQLIFHLDLHKRFFKSIKVSF